MATIRVSTVVPAPPEVVWEDLRHIDRHVEWMSEAVSIRMSTQATEGVGVRFECVTRLGPIRLVDQMEVTEWRDRSTMAIRHRGAVSGSGEFRLKALPAPGGERRTRFEWTEKLKFRWWMGGPLAAALARPVLRAVWSRNLRRFAARF